MTNRRKDSLLPIPLTSQAFFPTHQSAACRTPVVTDTTSSGLKITSA
jgi:hypothetical protein